MEIPNRIVLATEKVKNLQKELSQRKLSEKNLQVALKNKDTEIADLELKHKNELEIRDVELKEVLAQKNTFKQSNTTMLSKLEWYRKEVKRLNDLIANKQTDNPIMQFIFNLFFKRND